MKRFLYIFAVLLIGFSATAQEQEQVSLVPYVATGISIPNTGDFEQDSYISAEVGAMYENIAFAAVFGRNNLSGILNSNESFENYWYEAKVATYFPLGYVSGYILGGVGSYVENGNVFLEYGGGVSKEFGRVSLFVQVSNWDGVTYLTPGVGFGL